MSITLSIEEVVLWVCDYPSLCRGDCYFGFVPYLLCRGGCSREELCTSNFVIANSSVEVSCVGGPVWT